MMNQINIVFRITIIQDKNHGIDRTSYRIDITKYELDS